MKKWLLIISATVICVAAAFLYFFSLTPKGDTITSRESILNTAISKGNEWTIDRYHTDKVRISILFSLIRELPVKRRKWAIEYFLSLNDDPEIFEVLSLEPSSFDGTGSLIPAIQERIDFLSSLLPSVSGLKYLRQKNYIEKKIEEIRRELYEQEIRELLEAWNN